MRKLTDWLCKALTGQPHPRPIPDGEVAPLVPMQSMQRHPRRLLSVALAAANEAEGEPPPPAPAGEVIPFPAVAAANEFSVVQKDSLFVPFGEYPVTVKDEKSGRAVRCRQVFDLEAANAINDQLSGLRGMITGALRLLPIYVGHPDHPQFRDQHKDGRSYGWVTGVNAIRDDGVEFSVKWSKTGSEMIEEGHYMFYSPHWLMKPLGAANGELRARPVLLQSFGLTNQPNWPVPSLAVAGLNEMYPEEVPAAEIPAAEEPPPPAPSLLERLAALFGMADAAEEAVVAKVVELKAAVDEVARAEREKMEAADREWKAKEAAMQAAANEVETNLQAANERAATLDTEKTTLAARHTAALDALVTLAIDAGRIPGGKSEEWLAALNEDLDGTLARIQTADAGLPGPSRTQNLGARRPRQAAPCQAFLAAVNEYMDASRVTYETAWSHISRTRPDLKSALDQ